MADASPIIAARFWSKVEVGRDTHCWPWRGGTSDKGYGRFRLDDDLVLAHRVAYELFNGPIPDGDGYHGTVILHGCDNPSCCNPNHLRIGNHSDNMKDMVEKKRHIVPRVESGQMLTADAVEAIFNDPRPHRTIAAQYGIAKSTVWRIKTGRTPSAEERRVRPSPFVEAARV